MFVCRGIEFVLKRKGGLESDNFKSFETGPSVFGSSSS